VIARVWRAAALTSNAEAASDHLRRTGVLVCRHCQGNRGVLLLRHQREETTEFLFVSLWESMEALQDFAGADVDKPVTYAGDADYLIEADTRVRHYDVVEPSR